MTKLWGAITALVLVLVPLTAQAQDEWHRWFRCIDTAADALSAQPEPAETIAKAVFGSCGAEAWRVILAGDDIIDEKDNSYVLARILRNRAAKARER
jgi:hypothetical protein